MRNALGNCASLLVSRSQKTTLKTSARRRTVHSSDDLLVRYSRMGSGVPMAMSCIRVMPGTMPASTDKQKKRADDGVVICDASGFRRAPGGTRAAPCHPTDHRRWRAVCAWRRRVTQA